VLWFLTIVPQLLARLEKTIEIDLDWRNAEIAIFREQLSLGVQTETKKRAMFRAGWLLLYAHYEGFSKFCLEIYIEYMCSILKDCHGIPDKTFVYFVDKEIKSTKSMSSEDTFLFFKNEINSLRTKSPKPLMVDTKSNLWPEVLLELISKLDLTGYTIISDEKKLKTLVARRNDIAHGKSVFIDDLHYYLEYERVVINTMYELALAVVDRSGKIAEALKG